MEYQEKVRYAEERVNIQLEKIYQLVGQKAELEKIQIAYKEYIQKLSTLYQLFFEKIARQKGQGKITIEEWKKKKDALIKRYQEELMEIAVVVDQVLGLL